MKKERAFTLIEILIVLAIVVILAAMGFFSFRLLQEKSELQESSETVVSILRTAQRKTINSENQSQWGVYFDDTLLPHKYVLFQGSSYATRDASKDAIQELSPSLELYIINLADAGKEVVFSRLDGETNQFGMIGLRLKNDISQTRDVFISSSGVVSSISSSVSDDSRIKDSRHVHFNYSRSISTSTEHVTLIFTASPDNLKNLSIADFWEGGEFHWEGDVDVNGEIQHLSIRTEGINNVPIFCIHRDKRYNSRPLRVEISGDIASLIEYDINGLVSKGSSIYVSDPILQ